MLACKKDDEGSGMPIPQFQLINFIDSAGNNLFSINAIDTSEFLYDYNGGLETWYDLKKERDRILANEITLDEETEIIIRKLLEDNPYLFLEYTFGTLDVQRRIIISGKEHYFQFAPDEGIFMQNGKLLMYDTEEIAKEYITGFFLHNIVLNEY